MFDAKPHNMCGFKIFPNPGFQRAAKRKIIKIFETLLLLLQLKYFWAIKNRASNTGPFP